MLREDSGPPAAEVALVEGAPVTDGVHVIEPLLVIVPDVVPELDGAPVRVVVCVVVLMLLLVDVTVAVAVPVCVALGEAAAVPLLVSVCEVVAAAVLDGD